MVSVEAPVDRGNGCSVQCLLLLSIVLLEFYSVELESK